MEKVIILGGGIAGLSCLNALLDRGVPALLLERNIIGTPKMCGEFLAPFLLKQLANWKIGPVKKIDAVKFVANKTQLNLKLSQPGGAMARSVVELQLAERARQKGGRIRENALIKHVLPPNDKTPYHFYLDSGEEIIAKTAIFATGKLGEQQMQSSLRPIYCGVKVQFRGVVDPHTLLMFSLKDAYLGIVPIGEEESNCACLIKREAVLGYGSLKNFFNHLVGSHPLLKSQFSQLELKHDTWLEGMIPAFQIKKIPAWPDAFWIGDAVASLHPAIGSGFAHGVHSAVNAAEYYCNKKPSAYRKMTAKQIRTQFMISTLMHQLLLRPALSVPAFSFAEVNPWIYIFLIKQLRYYS